MLLRLKIDAEFLGSFTQQFVCFVCEASGQKIETLCQYRRSLRNITYA
jgi:hypothetical protein